MLVHNLTKLFCEIDDFTKQHQKQWDSILIENSTKKKRREVSLNMSEIMTIMVMFHQSNYRTFKHFYMYLAIYYKKAFPDLPSYSWFVRLMPRAVLPLCVYLCSLRGEFTGISFIDSTPIQVCKPKRMNRNKVFKDVAKKGKSTIGWFFGFKLHLIVNDLGEILSFMLTPGNVDDRVPVPKLAKELLGKLIGDKGYISSKLTKSLLEKGLHLITGIKKNMKNKLIFLTDKVLLRKRSIIETINDQLKNISQIEHSRHRSCCNFIVNLFSGLIAYSKQPKKPSIIHEQPLTALNP